MGAGSEVEATWRGVADEPTDGCGEKGVWHLPAPEGPSASTHKEIPYVYPAPFPGKRARLARASSQVSSYSRYTFSWALFGGDGPPPT